MRCALTASRENIQVVRLVWQLVLLDFTWHRKATRLVQVAKLDIIRRWLEHHPAQVALVDSIRWLLVPLAQVVLQEPTHPLQIQRGALYVLLATFHLSERRRVPHVQPVPML